MSVGHIIQMQAANPDCSLRESETELTAEAHKAEQRRITQLCENAYRMVNISFVMLLNR